MKETTVDAARQAANKLGISGEGLVAFGAGFAAGFRHARETGIPAVLYECRPEPPGLDDEVSFYLSRFRTDRPVPSLTHRHVRLVPVEGGES